MIFPDKDLQQQAASRILSQFRRSPVLMSTLYALITEVQALHTAIIDTQSLRTLDTATGIQLDAIGSIVGCSRDSLSAEDYRARIKAQIFRNMCQYGTPEDIQTHAKMAYSLDIIVRTCGPMQALIAADPDIDDTLLSALFLTKPSNTVEHAKYSPYPATLEVGIANRPLTTEDGAPLEFSTGDSIYTEG